MSSLNSSVSYRVNWRPQGLVMNAALILTITAVASISFSGLILPLKIIVLVCALAYSGIAIRRSAALPVFTLQQNCDGGLTMIQRASRTAIYRPVWRDYGYLIELSGCVADQKGRWCWWTIGLPDTEIRQLRLMMQSSIAKQYTKLPAMITNPVL